MQENLAQFRQNKKKEKALLGEAKGPSNLSASKDLSSYDRNRERRFKRIEYFLGKENFNGFTRKDLFIMAFIKKGWGQDIAALSNMAESIVNIAKGKPLDIEICKILIRKILLRAIHPKVNPYKKDIYSIESLGKYGYYLEHLNIILGAYNAIYLGDEKIIHLNKKISLHLLRNSMSYSNYHADLLPYVRMKWSADQAAIIYSLWLYDRNFNTNISEELAGNWFKYMDNCMTCKHTGLYNTEVLNTRKYSKHPRGCSLSYMIHYMGKFAPYKARNLWRRYKRFMFVDNVELSGFREYLPAYKGNWNPDSGPIIRGVGIAATGLGLNAASTVGDFTIFCKIKAKLDRYYSLMNGLEKIIGKTPLTLIGTDLLSSSVFLNAETKIGWYN